MKQNLRNRFQKINYKMAENDLLLPLDILLVGGTGTGKSSTLNALFDECVAVVGQGVDPETKEINSFQISDYLRFHDSAGLGDGKVEDQSHGVKIAHKLQEECRVLSRDYGLIDLVLVILDGSSRDLGTTYHLLESVILKYIKPDRVVVAVNQADMAMKGRYWDSEKLVPEATLINFLEEQIFQFKEESRSLQAWM